MQLRFCLHFFLTRLGYGFEKCINYHSVSVLKCHYQKQLGKKEYLFCLTASEGEFVIVREGVVVETENRDRISFPHRKQRKQEVGGGYSSQSPPRVTDFLPQGSTSPQTQPSSGVQVSRHVSLLGDISHSNHNRKDNHREGWAFLSCQRGI